MSILSPLLRGRSNLSCQQVVELVSDYLEGALTPRDRARFEHHIAKCPHCTEYLEQLKVTLDELGELREEDVAPPVRDELLEVFRNWSGRPPD